MRRLTSTTALSVLALSSLGALLSGCSLAAPPKGVLTVGTTYYIDSLNPFVGIEPQSDTAYEMIFPQLVQYGPGLKLQGDWAKSWTVSDDGRRWTFHLHGGGKWSDGVPLTAQDGAWTIDTILKYESGATSYYAGTLQGLIHASAPNADTLVLQYSRAEPTVLPNLEQTFILPEHIWDKYTGDDGNDLKSFVPNAHYPVVSGGPYVITQYQEKGTTVFRPNPYFYGPKSHAKAVTLTYYTNATSMLADLEAGELDFVDDVPYTIANRLKGSGGLHVDAEPGNEVTNLGFNSNPLKPKNRELLNPLVKEAFEYAIPRKKLIQVVFGGHAVPWANIMSSFSIAVGLGQPGRQAAPVRPGQGERDPQPTRLPDGSGRRARCAGDARTLRAARPPDELHDHRPGRPRLRRRPSVRDPCDRIREDRRESDRDPRRRRKSRRTR